MLVRKDYNFYLQYKEEYAKADPFNYGFTAQESFMAWEINNEPEILFAYSISPDNIINDISVVSLNSNTFHRGLLTFARFGESFSGLELCCVVGSSVDKYCKRRGYNQSGYEEDGRRIYKWQRS